MRPSTPPNPMSTITPPSLTSSSSGWDRNPSAFENGLAIGNKRLLEPGDHLARFVFGMTAFDVVVGKSDVERILARHEANWNKIPAGSGVGGIVAAIAVIPGPVPGAAIIGHRVIAARAFADPEDRRDNASLPRIPSRSSAQGCTPAHQRRSSHVARTVTSEHRLRR